MSSVAPPPAPVASSVLAKLHQNWLQRRALAVVLPTVAALLLLGVVGAYWPAWRWLALVSGVLLLCGVGWQLARIFRSPIAAAARQLDRLYPDLEDSTGLLLQHSADFNLLESLQQQRTSRRLEHLASAGTPLLPVAFRQPALLTAGLLVATAIIWWLRPFGPSATTEPAVQLHFQEAPVAGEKVMPALVRSTTIHVSPPTYTRQAGYTASQPSFRCPQGSRVRWVVRVSGRAAAPVLELGPRRLPMRAVAGQPDAYATEADVTSSALYRVRFAGKVSDDYAIDVQADQAPTLRLLTPKAYTLVEFGHPPQVAVRVALGDDYGLTHARLVATVAQGQGEAVKFREVATDLSAGLGGAQPTRATLQHVLRLPALGLTYGDEVYFYIQAWDNHQHSTRSDTYLVQWEDTAATSSTLDASLGVNTAPAYFRSQRQIIIDTEKLVAEQPRLAAATLLERANTIGFDQKVLRLRYGKFLGEEGDHGLGEGNHPPVAEETPEEAPGLGSVVAEDHAEPATAEHAAEEHTADDGHDHGHTLPDPNAPAGTEATAALMEAYIHRHDDSETADFLEPAVKAKLQGVLSQMWEAELRLRTGRPKEALPFEYRALRLLKQVQQQTRAYVKKAGFTPPPMPEATTRLTGDLAGTQAPRRQQQVATPAALPTVREALQHMSRLRQGQAVPSTAAATLDRAGTELTRAALQQPGRYLTALRALRDISGALRAGRAVPMPALPLAERALTDLLPPTPPAPQRRAPADRLARRYFQALEATSR